MSINGQDITGQRFGRLVAIRRTIKRRNEWAWLCQCDCGNQKEIGIYGLFYGSIRSCKCLLRESTSKRASTHRMTHTPEYEVWEHIIQRCYNSNDKKYKDYGGRGIGICERWRKFESFYEDMGKRPDGKSIDRINNDLGYFPENCRWATLKEQNRNTRWNRNVTFNGKTQCVRAWEEELGFEDTVLLSRLKRGWDLNRAFTAPVKKKGLKNGKRIL